MQNNNTNENHANQMTHLPFEARLGRPAIVFHPAAGAHWLASWAVASNLGCPFTLVANDIHPVTPHDAFHGVVDDAGTCPFVETGYEDAHGSQLFQHASLEVPHWLESNAGDAGTTLATLPLVDILYVDWFDGWIPPLHREATFVDYAAHFAHKVRDGGLILLDKKHCHMEDPFNWFDIPDDLSEVHPGVSVESLGSIVIPGDDGFAHFNGPRNSPYAAEVFKVHNAHLSGSLNASVPARLALIDHFANLDRVFCTRGAISREVNA